MAFLRSYPGLTGLISVKLAESGKVVRINSIDQFQAREHGGNLGAFVFDGAGAGLGVSVTKVTRSNIKSRSN
jgi:hypothetical protein